MPPSRVLACQPRRALRSAAARFIGEPYLYFVEAEALLAELCWNLGDAVIRRRVVLAYE
jgi:hypothetical protein